MLRLGTYDMSMRQLAALLICYGEEEPQTVRGLARRLNVSRPAISKMLNVLEMSDLVRRKTDPRDRRSVVVARTQAGRAFDRTLKDIMAHAAPARIAPPRRRAWNLDRG